MAKCVSSSTKVSLDETVRKNIMLSENSKKLREHIATFRKNEARKVMQVEELLKQKK